MISFFDFQHGLPYPAPKGPASCCRRQAVLAGLVQCLPAPMARLSADTLAFVNFACGSNVQCTCCCGADEEEEEEEEEGGAGSPCRGDDRDAGGSGGAGPSQALPMPAKGSGGSMADTPGPSSRPSVIDNGDEKMTALKGSASAAVAAATAARAEQHGRGLAALGVASGQPAPRFSKALVAAAEEQGEGLMAQSWLTLAFRSVMMEREYGRWISQYHIKVLLHRRDGAGCGGKTQPGWEAAGSWRRA